MLYLAYMRTNAYNDDDDDELMMMIACFLAAKTVLFLKRLCVFRSVLYVFRSIYKTNAHHACDAANYMTCRTQKAITKLKYFACNYIYRIEINKGDRAGAVAASNHNTHA